MKSKKNKYIIPIICIVLALIGLLLVFVTRPAAIAEGASDPDKQLYSLSLILTIASSVVAVASLLPKTEAKKIETKTMTTAALFAALCYIGFMFFKIDIPVGTEKTAFHLGNVFCVLAALLLGGFWGGMAGAVGMTIADLTSGYVTSAPKTFILKLCIGLIVGLVAHHGFKLNENHSRKYTSVAVVVSSVAGMAFNVIADPLVGYFYKMYVLGIPQEIADAWAKMGAITTFVNAVVAVVCASIFYLALRPALQRSGFFPLKK